MRVFVLVDMEGVAGVVNGEELHSGNPEYERARRLMTSEANAVVAGILDATPDAEVMVADAHGGYRNIIPEELDPRARLLRGKPSLNGMVDGLDETYDLAMFIGMHGQAGAGTSVLSHTFSDALLSVRLNGHTYGELGLNAAMAGAMGVPVALVAGDQVVAEEVRDALGPAATAVVVKQSRGAGRADAPHPSVACAMLREAAARAVREREALAPMRVAAPVTVEITLAQTAYADRAQLIEGIERMNGRTIRAVRPDVPSAYRLLRLVMLLSSVKA